MRTVNGGGDQLARGASKVQFKPAEGVTEDKWKSMFEDYDPVRFANAPNQSMQRAEPAEDGAAENNGSDTDVSAPGDASSEFAEVGPEFTSY